MLPCGGLNACCLSPVGRIVRLDDITNLEERVL
jgi:hypothetical protein